MFFSSKVGKNWELGDLKLFGVIDINKTNLSYAAWGLNKHTLGKIVLDFRITECNAIFLV